jgi:hypothetical protein
VEGREREWVTEEGSREGRGAEKGGEQFILEINRERDFESRDSKKKKKLERRTRSQWMKSDPLVILNS